MCRISTCRRQDLQRQLAVLLVLVRVLLPRAPQLAALAPRQRRRGFSLLCCCCLRGRTGASMSLSGVSQAQLCGYGHVCA